jgi:hypothetical protein
MLDAEFDVSFRDCPAKGRTGGHPIAYADDVDLVARNMARLAEGFVELEVAACRAGLSVNEKKTKYMINTREEHR